MLHRHQAGLGRVLELVVRPFGSRQIPALRFELLDEQLAVHAGNYDQNNHYPHHRRTCIASALDRQPALKVGVTDTISSPGSPAMLQNTEHTMQNWQGLLTDLACNLGEVRG
jgi:hypothetical protein